MTARYLEAIAGLVGGLVFLAFGLELLGRTAQFLAGVHLKAALHLLTRNRVTGLLVGVVMSFLLSSTSAAAATLAIMGSAGLLTLRQGLAVVLGNAVGASLTVQLIAFTADNWAVYILAVGFLVRTLARREHGRCAGNVLFAVGLIFLGMALMKDAARLLMATLGVEVSGGLLSSVTANPFYIFLIGIAAAAVVQSSVVTLALAFAFGLTAPEAIPLALGAGIGGCTAGLFSGIARTPAGRQILVGRFLTRVLGASFFMLILIPFTGAVKLWCTRLGVTSEQRIIAHANTLYTCLGALVFLPLIPVLEQVVLSLTGRAKPGAPPVGLSVSELDTPAAALVTARGQTANMARTALVMLRRNLTAFLVDEKRVTEDILAAKEMLDAHDAVISDYLRRIDGGNLGVTDNETRNQLLTTVRDLGRVSGIIVRDLVPLAHRKARKGLDFSIEGAQQLEAFHRAVADDLSEVVDILEGRPSNPDRVLANAPRVEALRQSTVDAHLRRVSEGVTADVQTSRILLDAISALRVIHYHIYDIVEVLHPRRSAQAR